MILKVVFLMITEVVLYNHSTIDKEWFKSIIKSPLGHDDWMWTPDHNCMCTEKTHFYDLLFDKLSRWRNTIFKTTLCPSRPLFHHMLFPHGLSNPTPTWCGTWKVSLYASSWKEANAKLPVDSDKMLQDDQKFEKDSCTNQCEHEKATKEAGFELSKLIQ